MMDTEQAKRKAARLPYPLPGGEIIKVPLEVCLAYMKLHNLTREKWLGDILVLKKIKTPSDSENPVGDPNTPTA